MCSFWLFPLCSGRIELFRLVKEKGLDLWLSALRILKTQGIYVETLILGEGPLKEKLSIYCIKHKYLLGKAYL